jgi:hypothetical protein
MSPVPEAVLDRRHAGFAPRAPAVKAQGRELPVERVDPVGTAPDAATDR